MTTDGLYRAVMMVDPPDRAGAVDAAHREHRFDTIWSGPALTVRDRRLVTIVCASSAVHLPAMDVHVYAALGKRRSVDRTVE